MKLKRTNWFGAGVWIGLSWIGLACAAVGVAQGISTTTVQGTVYLANGQPGSGTLELSWPAFTTSNDLAVGAGSLYMTVGADGAVSVNLAPNLGASPAGLFYTAVYYLSDGTVSTEYCRNAALALVQAASGANALRSGTYKTTNLSLGSDVWPGDALACDSPSMGLQAQTIVRTVRLS